MRTLQSFGMLAGSLLGQIAEGVTPADQLRPTTIAHTHTVRDATIAGFDAGVFLRPDRITNAHTVRDVLLDAIPGPAALRADKITHAHTVRDVTLSAVAGDPHFSNVILLAPFDTGETENVALSGYDLVSNDVAITTGGEGQFGECVRGNNLGNLGSVQGATNSDWDVDDQDFTLEGWFYRHNIDDASGFPTIFGRWGGSDADQSFVCFIDSSGKVGIAVRLVGGSLIGALLSSTTYPVLQWNHIVLERSGPILRLYMNGVMEAKSTGLSITAIQSGATFGIGRYAAERSFFAAGASNKMAADEVRFTLGVARYDLDAGYDVPTDPFPTS